MNGQQVEVLVKGPGELEQRLALPPGVHNVGRADDNELVLPDIAVSRRHARILVNHDSVVVEDVGSGNGTFIQGQSITSQQVGDAEEVVIDPFVLRFSFSQHVAVGVEAPVDEVPRIPLPRLHVLGGDEALSQEYVVPLEGLTLGRAEDRDVVLQDPAASRRHAEIALTGDRWVLRDLGSANGTLVNDQRVKEHVLGPDDHLKIGTTEFRFVLPALEDEPSVSEGTKPFANLMFTDPSGQVVDMPPMPSSADGMRGMPAPAVVPPVGVPVSLGAPPPPAMQPDASPPRGGASPQSPPAPYPAQVGFQAAPAPYNPAAPAPPPFMAAPAPGAPQPGVPQAFAAPAPAPAFGQAAPGGFGAVAVSMEPTKKGKKGRRMKMSASSAQVQGSFLQRNIRKLTIGIGLFTGLLVAFKMMRDVQQDMATTSRPPRGTISAPAPATGGVETSVDSSGIIGDLLTDGNKLFKDGNYLAAVEKYAEVQKVDSRNPTAIKMGYHACEFLILNDLAKTVKMRSTNETEQHEAYLSAMQLADDAIAGKRGASVSKAIAALEEIKPFFPDDESIDTKIDKLQGRVRAWAVNKREREQEAHESSINDLFNRAQKEVSRGDFISAIKAFEKVLAADPDKQTNLYWQAEEQIRQAKSTLSERARTSYRAGVEAMKKQDYLTARVDFRKALRMDPYNNAAARRLSEAQAKLDSAAQKLWSEAEVYEKSNQVDMAIGRYRKVIEYSESPSTSLAVKAQSRIDKLMR